MAEVPITMKSCIKWAVCLLSLLMVVAACGRKAPPEPPGRPELPLIDNLSAEPEDGSILIEWTIRAPDTKLLRNLSGFYVYRARREIQMADCESCPREYKIIADIPYGRGRTIPESWFYRDDPQEGFAYSYIVRGYSGYEIPGRASEAVQIIIPER